MTLEEAIEQHRAEVVEETVLTHTTIVRNNTVEARVVIVWRDKVDGTEWEYNDVKKFKLKQLKGRKGK